MWKVFFGKKKSQPTQLFPSFFPVHCIESLSFWATLPKLSTYSYLSLSKVFQVALQLQMCCTSMTSKMYLLFNYIIYLILNIIALLWTSDCLPSLNDQILIFFLQQPQKASIYVYSSIMKTKMNKHHKETTVVKATLCKLKENSKLQTAKDEGSILQSQAHRRILTPTLFTDLGRNSCMNQYEQALSH